jgi:hypothetical protein
MRRLRLDLTESPDAVEVERRQVDAFAPVGANDERIDLGAFSGLARGAVGDRTERRRVTIFLRFGVVRERDPIMFS